MSYEIHTLALAYPSIREIDPDGFAAMVEDMKTNGWQGEPATLLDGKILDGRSRYEAWTEAGGNGDMPTAEFAGDNPQEFVRRQNGQRRNLSSGQKVLSHLRATHGVNLGVGSPTVKFTSSRELGRICGVHHSIAASAIKVCTSGVASLIEAVWLGLISLNAAEEMASKAPVEQEALLDEALQATVPVSVEKKTKHQEKAEREVSETREFFFSRVAKVADGGRYTREDIAKACEFHSAGEATWFLRMCEIAPQVRVHRTYGHKGIGQYGFEYDPEAKDGWDRVKKLLQEIGTRPDSSSQDRLDAEEAIRILSL